MPSVPSSLSLSPVVQGRCEAKIGIRRTTHGIAINALEKGKTLSAMNKELE